MFTATTCSATPAADDNASGVAALLEISRALAGMDLDRTVRCVASANEEPPYFSSSQMGSQAYAKMAYDCGDEILHMISIESVGNFSDAEDSRQYPEPIAESYPSTGNFIGVVSDMTSQPSAALISNLLKESETIPVEVAVLPSVIPGVDWSDHASFWLYGYSGVMVTDTGGLIYVTNKLATIVQ